MKISLFTITFNRRIYIHYNILYINLFCMYHNENICSALQLHHYDLLCIFCVLWTDNKGLYITRDTRIQNNCETQCWLTDMQTVIDYLCPLSPCHSQRAPTTARISNSLSQGSATTDDFSDRPSITYRWEPRDTVGDFRDPPS